MTYKSVYFLHVVKTGGRFFMKNILEPISSVLKNNGIQIIDSVPFQDGTPRKNRHVGWDNRIEDNTYIISFFREPASWACSWFSHIHYQRNKALDLNNRASIIKHIDLSKEDFFSWAKEEKVFHNYQSKNYILGADNIQSSINNEIEIFERQNKNIDYELLYSRLERVNLLMKQEDFKNIDYNIFLNKISEDLKVDLKYSISKDIERTYNNNISSENLYNQLNDLEKDQISKMNIVDLEVYNSEYLFWKGV
jgi:hypothetical protein